MKKYFHKLGLVAILGMSLALLSMCGDDDDVKNDDNTQNSVENQDQTNNQNGAIELSTNSIIFAKEGGTVSFTVKCAEQVVVFGDDNWAQAKLVGSDNGVYTYEVTVAKNPSADQTCTLTVAGAGSTATITVFQSCDDKLELSQQKQSVEANGGEVTFSVSTKLEYTVDVKSSWLTLKSNDGDNYTFTVAANPGYATRNGRISITAGSSTQTFIVSQAADKELVVTSDMTAMQLAQYMYPAWNLGNTLEALGGETSWQTTKTTQEVIDFVAESGFRAVRIPCSWYIHSVGADHVIDANWMARVKEIVDYCMNANLFVELNDHWDNGWIEEYGFSSTSDKFTAMTEDKINEKAELLANLWTQIAEAFKDYDNKLMFAGLNEPFQNYSLFDMNLSNKAQTLQPILEKYNQTFVDAVRATGGNNATRILVIQAPGASLDYALQYLNMPTDIVENKLMMEGHYYTPWNFCGEGTNPTYIWNSENSVKDLMEKLKAKFCDNGIPVLIGEYGANWRDYSNQEKHDASIKAWFKDLSKWGPSNGCLPFVWDVNYCPETRGKSGTMTIINRSKLEIYCPPAYEGIMEGTDEAVWPY